jgi:repressor LexA
MTTELRRRAQNESVLTPTQRRTLDLVQQTVQRQGYPPTMQELALSLGIKGQSVHDQINQLVRKGYLRRVAGKARGLTVLRPLENDVSDLVPIPIVGRVAAGRPIFAEQNVVGELLVDSRLTQNTRCFALKVQGDSMTQAGIKPDDLLVVRQQPIAEPGDVVVALVDSDATVKRLFIRDGCIELRPESNNRKHRPITIGPDTDLRIVGKVVGVRRERKSVVRKRPRPA